MTKIQCLRSGMPSAEMLQRAMALLVLIEPASLPEWQQEQLGKLVSEWLELPGVQNG